MADESPFTPSPELNDAIGRAMQQRRDQAPPGDSPTEPAVVPWELLLAEQAKQTALLQEILALLRRSAG
jgi:hypothetical protein